MQDTALALAGEGAGGIIPTGRTPDLNPERALWCSPSWSLGVACVSICFPLCMSPLFLCQIYMQLFCKQESGDLTCPGSDFCVHRGTNVFLPPYAASGKVALIRACTSPEAPHRKRC